MPAPSRASRVAIVTGGSCGIDRQVVRRLAANGFTIAVNYASNQAEADEADAEAGGNSYAARADVADQVAIGERTSHRWMRRGARPRATIPGSVRRSTRRPPLGTPGPGVVLTYRVPLLAAGTWAISTPGFSARTGTSVHPRPVEPRVSTSPGESPRRDELNGLHRAYGGRGPFSWRADHGVGRRV